MLRRPAARFPLARELRSEAGATLGDVFTFASGLYFRGKLAYARSFGASWVITAGSGLVEPDRRITPSDLDLWARVRVDLEDGRYRGPLERDARALATRFPGVQVVLLGSIASDKYVELLLEVFDHRLLFPVDFVGRGDMSRGGLLLRSARSGTELPYGPVRGAVRHGPRPPRLPKLRGASARSERLSSTWHAPAGRSPKASRQVRHRDASPDEQRAEEAHHSSGQDDGGDVHPSSAAHQHRERRDAEDQRDPVDP